MLIFTVAGPFARTILTTNEMWQDHSYLSCMDGIAFGCIAALLANRHPERSEGSGLNAEIPRFARNDRVKLLFLGFSLFMFIFIFRKQVFELGLSTSGLNVTILEISIGLILIAVSGINFTLISHSFTAPLRWLGRLSYEVYLIHSFFIIALSHLFFSKSQSIAITVMLYFIAIIISGLAGQLVSRYFSEPMNRFIKDIYVNKILIINSPNSSDQNHFL